MKKIALLFVIIMIIFGSVSSLADTTPEPSLMPTESVEPTLAPTPEPTAAIIENSPVATETVPENTEEVTAPETISPISTPAETKTPAKENDDSQRIRNGEMIFWIFVALIVGIWIGVFIGAAVWRKKSVFMTDKEKKIIGRMK